jgi:HSP20 family protein
MRSLTLFNDLEKFWGNNSWAPEAWDRARTGFLPAVDVEESEKDFTLHLDLPGLEEKDIKLEVLEDVLKISGERKFEKKTESKGLHRTERSYGTFERSFTMPREVNVDKIDAQFKNGVLTVVLPKTEAVKPRQINIKKQ